MPRLSFIGGKNNNKIPSYMKTTSQRERACDEESEERSEGLTVARAAKQVKKR